MVTILFGMVKKNASLINKLSYSQIKTMLSLNETIIKLISGLVLLSSLFSSSTLLFFYNKKVLTPIDVDIL